MSGQLWTARQRPVRTRAMSGVVDIRATLVTAVITIAALGLGWVALTTGSGAIGPADVLAALTGSADEGTTRVVVEWRLPRVLFALVGGAALAVSGAVFQSVTRNPLGSPDIIGFSTGAYTGTLVAGLLGFTQIWAAPLGALIGGVASGVLVFLLASGPTGPVGLRIIIIGIGVGGFLTALNAYLLTTMRLEEAIAAATWGAGSLSDIAWTHVIPLLIIALAIPALAMRGRDLTLMEMGDDAAQAVGIPITRRRIEALVLAIALVAVVTASAGPIAFVALAAPQLAMRLCGQSTVRILPSAAMGALVLIGSDLIARSIVPGSPLPVGVVTLCIGGAYLVWLLTGIGFRSSRRVR